MSDERLFTPGERVLMKTGAIIWTTTFPKFQVSITKKEEFVVIISTRSGLQGDDPETEAASKAADDAAIKSGDTPSIPRLKSAPTYIVLRDTGVLHRVTEDYLQKVI